MRASRRVPLVLILVMLTLAPLASAATVFFDGRITLERQSNHYLDPLTRIVYSWDGSHLTPVGSNINVGDTAR